MEFTPHYYSPESEQHLHHFGYPQQYYMMDRGELPPQDVDASVMNHPSSQQCSSGEDAGSTSQKEQEETDTSSRPRLTAEQTSVLETHFQRESKPITDIKKRLAQQVGLPLDKVNNWYQNRRAKAKHLKKLRYLEFRPSEVVDNLYHRPIPYHDAISPLYGPAAYFGAGLGPMQAPPASTDYRVLYTNALGHHPALEHPQPRDPVQVWAGLPEVNPHLQAQLEQERHDSMMSEHFMDSQHTHLFATETMDDHSSAPAFPNWENGQPEPTPWTALQSVEGQLADAHPMLLQQQAPPLYIPEQPAQHLNDHTVSRHSMMPHHVYGHGSNESSQTVLAPQPQETQAQPAEAVTYATVQHRSPPAEAFSRPSSHNSSLDLTESFNNTDFQKVRTPSMSEESEIKPHMHSLNLALRRRGQRPPTLGVRSYSATSPQRSSPGSKPFVLGPSNSVRRIKSMGNSLNVMSGRVQKSVPAQKSPLNYTTFQEAGVFDHAEEPVLQSVQVESYPTNDFTPQTSHDPSMTMGGGPVDWPQPDVFESHGIELPENSSQTNHLVGHAVSRSVSISQQHQIMSPPHTPFGQEMHQVNYMSPAPCAQYTAPPQSAPPYLASFPHHSSPHPQQATPVTPAGCVAPPFNVPDAYAQFFPGPAYQLQQQQAHMMSYPQYAEASMPFHQSHMLGSSPSMGGHNMFYLQPPAPPAKDLEIVQMTFPKPPKVDQGPREPYQSKVYSFHHMSASDLANAGK